MLNENVEILLVEDNEDDVDLTLRALKSGQVTTRIHVSRNGAEALDFLFGDTDAGFRVLPKLIMLDLKLPLVDGIEVLRRIKADARTSMIPVVILTSSREESDLAKTYQLGTNSFIVKPVDFAQFTSAVQQVGLYWLLLNQPPSPT